MSHRRHAPQHNHDREAGAGAEPVHQPAGDQQADGIGELKGKDDVRVVDLGPAELGLEGRLEDADHLAVDVVDGRGEEQQPADVPAVASDRRDRRGRGRGIGERRGGRRRTTVNRNRRGRHHTLQVCAIRWWDCAGESRTRGGRASRRRSAVRRRPRGSRRRAARPTPRASPSRP